MTLFSDLSLMDVESHWPVLVAAGAALLVAFLILRLRRLRRQRGIDFESGLTERLADYPPAGSLPARIRFEGQPVHVRLVVLAPSGRGGIQPSMVHTALEAMLYGLGDAVKADEPRVRIWPPQLSQHGFAPAFFRRVVRPEPKDLPSRWILVAGPVRFGTNTILVGLALQAREPTLRGSVVMKVDNWPDRFRVQGPE
jgi:hypothetical protein